MLGDDSSAEFPCLFVFLDTVCVPFLKVEGTDFNPTSL